MRISPVVAAMSLALCAGGVEAASYTFAGYTFDQGRVTDTLGLIGNGETHGGAVFSANYANNITQSVAFVASSVGGGGVITGQSGFDPTKSLGRQANAQHGLTQPDGSSSHYASAINLPRGNNGASARHGLEMSWSGNRALSNGTGADFLVYESASTPVGFEAFMIRARNAETGEWSRWFYQDADGFENYLGESAEGAHAYAYDMSNLGFGAGDLIDAVQLANLRTSDRIDGSNSTAGYVNFDGTGLMAQFMNNSTFSNYSSGAHDPDPLYAVALGDLVTLGQVIPLPTGGAMALAGLGIVGARRRRA